MSSNRLQGPPQAPPRFSDTPSTILSKARHLIERSRKAKDELVAHVPLEGATFANVLLPLANDENSLAVGFEVLKFYQSVSTDPELRDASAEAEKLFNEFVLETETREDLYDLVKSVFHKSNLEELDPESYRLLEKKYKDYYRNGLGLPKSQRDRFKEIQKHLSQLKIDYKKNLNSENGGLWLTLQELDGVPVEFISTLQNRKTDENHLGKVWLSFKAADISMALRNAKTEETRKKIFIANENKCPRNAEILKEAVVLRDEAARLLGYSNHASFRIEKKMAQDSETVEVFLDNLWSKLTSSGQKELAEQKQLKKADLESRGKPFNGFYLWDHSFYTRLMNQNELSIDQEKIAEYFPLQTTVQNMLGIFEKLFGLVFKEMVVEKGSDIVWHEDVMVFNVWDDEDLGSGFVGYLYMDLFSRVGKYPNPSNWNLQPGFTQQDETRSYPSTALLCQFPKPSPGKPSLLRHDDVVMIFHELGHSIHDLVAKTTYSTFHGTKSTEDFAEAPSQMLENWCWIPSQLKSLSRHYLTLSTESSCLGKQERQPKSRPSDQIPDEMITGLIQSRNWKKGLYHLWQIFLSVFDMKIHTPTTHQEIIDLDISSKFNSLRKAIRLTDGPETLGQGHGWGHGEANIPHWMGTYDAGFYSYLWSEVYALDIFYTAFKPDPLNAKEGRRYRHLVLEKGDSQDGMKTLTEFLGREPSREAFFKELGLA
ncbi:Metallopeptidase MepB [Penicillium malachiteum]|uniref:Metallopeptidase MepB n=1 Tax=Penicillium malachiteum TaxID=1324776 RepID=UPI002549C0AE|nr:Metallopeptidase MepB [Penicillium malachiteum]KAJ5729344.1 Metallopeptidase MepB [Penicillium malachiteum]